MVRRSYFESTRIDAYRVLDILRRDGPGFDAKRALSELKIRVSWLLVREVLTGFLRNINEENKTRCAKLGFSCGLISREITSAPGIRIIC